MRNGGGGVGKRFHLKESSILMNKDSGLKSTGLSVIFLRNESGTSGLGILSLETMYEPLSLILFIHLANIF